MTDAIYSKIFQVRGVDIDQSGRIQPVIFMDYFLESAAEHAALFQVAVTDLFEKGRTWVLSRFHIEFLRYPHWGESVEIKTWPSAKLPLFALRDFEATDEHGIAARATSSWLIIDLATKRPVRTSEHLENFPQFMRRAVEDDFASLPVLSRVDIRKEFPVFFFVLDLNRHVTATAYVHRALESVPEDILFKFRPASIEVNFRAEAFYGDSIVSRVERIDAPSVLKAIVRNIFSPDQPETDPNPGPARSAYLHRLSRAADDKELTILRTSWAKMD